MKNLIILFLFQFLFAESSVSQNYIDYKDYRDAVKGFYSLMFLKYASIGELSNVYAEGGIRNEADLILCDSLGRSAYSYENVEKISNKLNNTTPSYIIKKMRLYESEIIQGLSLMAIDNLIDNAKIYNQGEAMIIYLEIDFPNNKKIYFGLDPDIPTKIIWIWLNNGDLLEGKFSDFSPDTLLFPGMIDDPDGFTNIREKPTKDSKVVDKFNENEWFYYVPCGDCEWLHIKRQLGQGFIGYIHKSRVKNYLEFPLEFKKKVQKQLND